MKAISLWQPWASLIACGAKRYETRSWAPPRELIGQSIAIHAAKKIDRGAAEFAQDLIYGQHEPGGFELAEKLAASFEKCPADLFGFFGEAVLPIGCVVAVVRLETAFMLGEPDEAAAVPAARIERRVTVNPMREHCVVPYDPWGDYSPGRWAWLLTVVKPLNPPVAMKGRQGFFDLPQGWLT